MKNKRSLFVFFTMMIFIACGYGAAKAQIAEQPELSIAGFRIGDEESAKELLKNYSPRFDNERSQPQYLFYNNYANQVLTVTAHSKERPHLIVAVEVFGVSEKYQKKHFQLKEHNAFISESGFFIGARPSATSLIFAIPNVTRPGGVIDKKGQPQTDEKTEKNVRTLRYELGAIKELEAKEAKLKDVDFGAYTAEYRFYKNKLSRFRIAVNSAVMNK